MSRFIVNEDSSFSLMQRIHADGVNIEQADVSSIAYKVTNTNTGVEISGGTLTVSTVVYDTLQTDSRWEADSTGYNFRHDFDQTTLTDPDVVYVIEYEFTLISGNKFITDPFEISVRRLRYS